MVAATVFVRLLATPSFDYDPILFSSVTVHATEMGGYLQGSLILNPDSTNPYPLNEDSNGYKLADSETRDPEFVPFTCADFDTLPEEVISNCGEFVESVSKLFIKWPTLYNPNTPLGNPALLNPAIGKWADRGKTIRWFIVLAPSLTAIPIYHRAFVEHVEHLAVLAERLAQVPEIAPGK